LVATVDEERTNAQTYTPILCLIICRSYNALKESFLMSRSCNVLKESFLVSRCYITLKESPLVMQLAPAIGVIGFAVWGLGPLMRYSRQIFLRVCFFALFLFIMFN